MHSIFMLKTLDVISGKCTFSPEKFFILQFYLTFKSTFMMSDFMWNFMLSNFRLCFNELGGVKCTPSLC